MLSVIGMIESENWLYAGSYYGDDPTVNNTPRSQTISMGDVEVLYGAGKRIDIMADYHECTQFKRVEPEHLVLKRLREEKSPIRKCRGVQYELEHKRKLEEVRNSPGYAWFIRDREEKKRIKGLWERL